MGDNLPGRWGPTDINEKLPITDTVKDLAAALVIGDKSAMPVLYDRLTEEGLHFHHWVMRWIRDGELKDSFIQLGSTILKLDCWMQNQYWLDSSYGRTPNKNP